MNNELPPEIIEWQLQVDKFIDSEVENYREKLNSINWDEYSQEDKTDKIGQIEKEFIQKSTSFINSMFPNPKDKWHHLGRFAFYGYASEQNYKFKNITNHFLPNQDTE